MKFKLNQVVQSTDGEDCQIIAFEQDSLKQYTVILLKNGTKHRRAEYELMFKNSQFKRKTNFV